MPDGLFRTSTILPNIRILWGIRPTFILISGGSLSHKTTPVQAHRGFWLLTLASYTVEELRGCKPRFLCFISNKRAWFLRRFFPDGLPEPEKYGFHLPPLSVSFPHKTAFR